MTRQFPLLAWLVIAALMLGASARASAHLTPNSEVRLTFEESQVTADIIVPQGEYAYATGNPVDNGTGSKAIAHRYLAERIAVTGTGGRDWAVAIAQPEFVQIAGPPDLHARATFTPPAGETVGQFTMRWRVLVDTLPNHFALVVVDASGREGEIVGAVRSGKQSIEVSKTESPLSVLIGAVVIGAQHIATGYDHLLFLLALLLPAPLMARGGLWRERRTLKATMRTLALIVTAFTAGHSLTLVGATLGGWRLPTAPVEVAIAVSVLVSALHAIKPIFPGREPVVAGAFGLVHGLAFATLVHDAGAGVASSALGLLGFNLGIELVQLAVVIVVVPLLVLLSAHANYSLIRASGGAACALAAGIWIVTRSIDAAPRLPPPVTGSLTAIIVLSIALIFVSRFLALQRGEDVFESDRG